jgi:hypothetical protein
LASGGGFIFVGKATLVSFSHLRQVLWPAETVCALAQSSLKQFFKQL